MRRRPSHSSSAQRQAGYLVVLFVIVLAFVAIAASMHVLILTSVATASRAYDSFRQGSIELTRLQSAVAESVLDQRQIGVRQPSATLADSLTAHLTDLTGNASLASVTSIPTSIPTVVVYPDSSAAPDPLVSLPADFAPYLTPELATIMGPHVSAYPEITFRFATHRTVFETTRTYNAEVRARLVAVPLTRFSIAAYELPTDIGSTVTPATPTSTMPGGLVPARDPAFIGDLQALPNVLPYHYRRRALQSAAYQYLFSQPFIDRVAEYAGIAHYCDLAGSGGTASLAGLTINGATATWDLAQAGSGTFGTVTTVSDAAVLFTESAGYTLQLTDTLGSSTTTPLFLLVLGPSRSGAGNLAVNFSTIARPLVFVGFNVRVTGSSGSALNGAVFLDPQSSFATTGPITVGHLSYWAGATTVDVSNVAATAMPTSAEALAPRVVYVSTAATPL